MDFKDLKEKAIEIDQQYRKLSTIDRDWHLREYTEGLVGDVGDLMKLVMAKSGLRGSKIDIDDGLKHELSDCLWSLIMIASDLEIELDEVFVEQMDKLALKIKP